MEQNLINALRQCVERDGTLAAQLRAQLLAELRAEAFWSERAPAMHDELMALRRLEAPARALVAQDKKHKQAGPLGRVLGEVDALRAEQAKAARAAT